MLTRRSFFSALAACATAMFVPVAKALGGKPFIDKIDLDDWRFDTWPNYHQTGMMYDQDEFIRRLKKATETTKFYPPIKP